MFERVCHIIDSFSTSSRVSRRKGPFFFKPAAFQLLSRARIVQKSYYGPCKTNRSESGRRFQRFYYEKTLVGHFVSESIGSAGERERKKVSFFSCTYVQLPLFCLLSKDCCNGVGVFPTGNGRESTRPQLLSEIEAESGALSLSAKAAGGGGGGNVTILFGKRHVALLYACSSSSSSQVCKSSCVASSLHRLWDALSENSPLSSPFRSRCLISSSPLLSFPPPCLSLQFPVPPPPLLPTFFIGHFFSGTFGLSEERNLPMPPKRESSLPPHCSSNRVCPSACSSHKVWGNHFCRVSYISGESPT